MKIDTAFSFFSSSAKTHNLEKKATKTKSSKVAFESRNSNSMEGKVLFFPYHMILLDVIVSTGLWTLDHDSTTTRFGKERDGVFLSRTKVGDSRGGPLAGHGGPLWRAAGGRGSGRFLLLSYIHEIRQISRLSSYSPLSTACKGKQKQKILF